jgi:two-component system OmpR family sensor kinase
VPFLTPYDLSTTEDTFLTVNSTGDEQYRVLARPGDGLWNITALSLEGVEAASHRLMLIEGLSIVAVLGGLALVGWWVIRLGIAPMRRMVDASALIAEGNFDARLDGAGSGTESAALAASLNTMIGRLTDSIAEKERSEAKLREFVADASHELRTPLTTVLGYAQLFRKGGVDSKEDQADAWSRTEAEATRMKRLVEDMLELARYDAEPELHLAPTDVNVLVAEVLADARRAHPAVNFAHENGGGSGPVAPDLDTHAVDAHAVVTADADRIRQAVINVVANAAQHGAEHVTVSVSRLSGRAGAEVRISVADDGPGMSPEVAARATERFVRGDSSRSRATGGAGLGLAITAAILEAHSGSLVIASAVGDGTTVTMGLPA